MKALQGVFQTLAVSLMLSIVLQANGQGQVPMPPTSPCTAAMLSSFNPCISYLTNGNGTGSPTSDCCNSLRALMTNGTDCLCQMVTGGVPFRIPVNRTSAISLPKACNQASVPVQCKASAGAPVPASAPGPAAFTPSASPAAAVAPTPSGGSVPATTTPAAGPVSDTTPDLTPATPGASIPPTSTSTGTGAATPSAAVLSLSLSPSFLLLPVALIVINYF